MEMIVPGTNWKAKLALGILSAAAFWMSGHGVARSDDDKPVQLDYSQWTKICADDRNSDLRGCLTGEEGRIDAGQRVITAVVVERAGEKPLIRVVLPLGMLVVHGTRLIVDNNKPMQAPYINCQATGCVSEYELTSDLRDLMKRGTNLIVQAINSSGAALNLPLPLAGFENALNARPSEQADIERDLRMAKSRLPFIWRIQELRFYPHRTPERQGTHPLFTRHGPNSVARVRTPTPSRRALPERMGSTSPASRAFPP
jgi:invasion protein IalB